MQKRFIKYKDSLVSFDTNTSKSGIIPGSVYRGFDTLNTSSDLTLTISHELTGEVMPDINEADTSPMGVWMDRQGATVKEDGPISLEIQTNATNSSQRKDYIVAHHHHDILAPGGVAATYEVLRGPLESLALPGNPEGNDWVIIGTLIIPALAEDTSGVTLKRAKIPSLGNKFPALLEEENRYEEQQQEFQGGTKIITSSTIDGKLDRNVVGDLNGGNLLTVQGTNKLDLLPNKPDGTEIELYFSQDTTLRPFISQLTGDNITAGFSKELRAIVINFDTSDNLIIKANQIATFRKYNAGGVYSVGTKVFGEFWKLISVSDTPDKLRQYDLSLTSMNASIAALTASVTTLAANVENLDYPGNIKSYKIFGNILDYFTTTGRGKPDSPWPKHQICNGLIGTPDLRDRNLRGFSGDISTYDSTSGALIIDGPNQVTLTGDNLPEHFHYMFADHQPGDPDLFGDHEAHVSMIRERGSSSDYRMTRGNVDPYMGRTGTSTVPGGTLESIDIRGKVYFVIHIMKLTPALIAANPYI